MTIANLDFIAKVGGCYSIFSFECALGEFKAQIYTSN